ncbi:hypothetical protein [Sphingomicrobium nitratireducens]|uniref:hypothetical protein n=1 Tax=Sphingomicrobium nitratireducens TaxID=2964666 RepID=UPI002240BC8B|nr:hypothetical protein [Sphingomicrobium nitratireducens]
MRASTWAAVAAAAITLMTTGCSPKRAGASSPSVAAPVGTARYDVHVDPWFSLHSFAWNAARNASGLKLRSRARIDDVDRALLERPDIAQAFAPLAAAYAPTFDMHPLFSKELYGIGLAASLDRSQLDPALREALEAFMPVYRTHFWPRHEAEALAMKNDLEGALDRRGDRMAAILADSLGSEWGELPIRVDLVPYATRAGAYTSQRRIVIAALDPDMRARPLEMVFHESSHRAPLGDRFEAAAEAALARHGLANERFWHHLLFTASAMAARDVPGDDYVPYPVAVGLAGGESKPWYDALFAVWDRHETLEARADAAAAMVAANEGR